ncbi:MAG TPA: TonB-dependent receptor plug domain-containing protein, partial [Niabella sp.]
MRKIIGLFSFILLSLIVTAQEKSIRGTVTKNDGTPVPFASIVVEGYPQSGSSSDDEGKFEIKVPQGSTQLKVSAIGYLTVTAPITGAIIQVSLTEDKTDMGEVVVVGYGKQKKITSLGAIASVTGQELRQSPAASLQNALVGRLPGVFQLQTSGQPGSDAANIYLRGISTYVGGGAAQQPLVIIDNVEGSISQLTQLDANEVESLSILTDASSTAIYGVKGANGVIIVTTRKG